MSTISERALAKEYWRCVEVADMAQALGWSLWGNSPDGRIRVAPDGVDYPTGTLSCEEIRDQFLERFRVEPIRRGSQVWRIVPLETEAVC